MTATPSSSRRHSLVADVIELLGSMRFAVSLLTFICVASIIGTVLPQNQPANNYIDRFGPFWYELFDKFSIWKVYNSWWFLLIMAFLVVSTSLCLLRNAPKMLRDARSFREHIRQSSLRAFHHRVECESAEDVERTAGRVRRWLAAQGYAVRERRDGDALLLAAKRGSANRLGYIFAHAAIVVICIGGLLDSELPVRLQIWLGDKKPVVENMLIADVPDSGRLSPSNPSYRASVLVPEGTTVGNAVVMVDDGALVQPLPFEMTLKKFVIDYYSTGMPSRFASEVEVRDPQTGHRFEQVIEVNEPLRYKGVTVYQSSFDDGGSPVQLVGRPLAGARDFAFKLDGRVGGDLPLDVEGLDRKLRIEITGLRPINVEDLSGGDAPQPRDLGEHVAAVTGSAAGKRKDNLRNVGPSIQYRLIDETGQSREFNNYMLPVVLDGQPVFLSGVRANPAENFRYVRIPADAQGTIDEFMRLRAALQDPQARREAARRFAAANVAAGADREPLQTSAERALETFARGGLQEVADFLEKNVPGDELPRAADIIIRLLGASIGELRNVARERDGLAPLPAEDLAGEDAAAWSRLAVAALSDLALYPAPVWLSLADFQHKQASVFQVTRTPGKNAVYLGCLLLVLGVFAMFYVRDRRIWVWLRPAGADGTAVLAAMTSQKRTLDFNREFERFRQALADLAKRGA